MWQISPRSSDVNLINSKSLMKHIIRKVLFLLLLLSTNRVALAYDFECGGLYYNILSEEDRTVEVTYYDYYTGFDAMKVIVPEEFIFEGETYKVTSIGEAAFRNSTSLMAVVIPNSVTLIGGSAFLGCSSLESVVIGNSVTSIGISAFWGCTSLDSISLPNSLISIGPNAFYHSI